MKNGETSFVECFSVLFEGCTNSPQIFKSVVDLYGYYLHCFTSYNNALLRLKRQVFVIENVSQLVADTSGVADDLVDIAVRMTVNPVFDGTCGDIVAQFDGKSSVQRASFEFRSVQLE